jgi:hypothetical protein
VPTLDSDKNTNKLKCTHVRKDRAQRSDFVFKIGGYILEIVEYYKYLGITFHEKCDYQKL